MREAASSPSSWTLPCVSFLHLSSSEIITVYFSHTSAPGEQVVAVLFHDVSSASRTGPAPRLVNEQINGFHLLLPHEVGTLLCTFTDEEGELRG